MQGPRSGSHRRVVLIVQDGWGIAAPSPGNLIELAHAPFYRRCLSSYPHARLASSGGAVGLPEGTQGNSEVGHLHIGAGRVVWQMYERINRAVRDGSLKANPAIRDAIAHAKRSGGTLHLIGLCSDGGVHSHLTHLYALLEAAKDAGLRDVAIHFFADGRDVPERCAEQYAREIETRAAELGVGRIASLIGRFYAMDRDSNWERTRRAYDLLVQGEGHKAKDIHDAIAQAYARGEKTDYYIEPTVLEGFSPVKDGDSVLFFNYRTDRPRQLTRAFVEEGFGHFPVSPRPRVLFTTMTDYDKTLSCPHAFTETSVTRNLGEAVAQAGLRQLRVAETEKYAHVTYFFNSQVEVPNEGEDRRMVPSAKVPSYDLKPEMSAHGIVDVALEGIASGDYGFILVNFANCDLVGHSGVKEAVKRAVEVVDECTAKVVEAALAHGYTCYLTADHGNAEDMAYPSGEAKPSHTTNPVYAFIISNDEDLKSVRMRDGAQQDAAPTVLDIMGIAKPEEMTGTSLIVR